MSLSDEEKQRIQEEEEHRVKVRKKAENEMTWGKGIFVIGVLAFLVWISITCLVPGVFGN